MMDTVALNIPSGSFHVIEPEKFYPNCESMMDPYSYQSRPFIKAVQNPTKQEKKAGIYKPKLTMINRLTGGRRVVVLRVEFSAPKILFGNSFDELEEVDFERLLYATKSKLCDMGVVVQIENLKDAPIAAIHFSKNVVYDDYTSATMILKELAKVNVSNRLDIGKTDYRDGGHCIRYHTNSFEVAFYDKIKDLEQAIKSQKRAIEDDNYCQSNIFDALKKTSPFEVVRFEVRLGNTTKIEQIFHKVGISEELSLRRLFKTTISKKVLLHFWQQIDEGIDFFAVDSSNPTDLLNLICQKNPDLGSSTVLKMLGAIWAIQEGGVRNLRSTLEMNGKKSGSWYALRKQLKAATANLKKNAKYHSLNRIEASINEFKPLRLKDHDINLIY